MMTSARTPATLLVLSTLLVACATYAAASPAAADADAAAATPTVLGGLMTQQCYDTLIVRRDVTDAACVKALISKALSYAIIVGALLLKVPQIIKIYAAGSAKGLSLSSLYQDCLTFTIGIAFNTLAGSPLPTYAEQIVILVQNVALVMMVWSYDARPVSYRVGVATVFAVLVTAAFQCPPDYRQAMFYVTIPLNATSRLSQAWSNFSQGHTGQLALLTATMQLGGSAARVFTSLQERVAAVIFHGFWIGTLWNAVLVAQILWYWTATNEANAAAAAARKKSQRKKKQ